MINNCLPTNYKAALANKPDSFMTYTHSDTPPEDTNLLWIDSSDGNRLKYYDKSIGAWNYIMF